MLDVPHQMRTTLSLDDHVLAAARVLARQALVAPHPETAAGREPASRNGLPLLPLQPGGAPVDLNLVNHLRDELP
jgi:hypothetical protein